MYSVARGPRFPGAAQVAAMNQAAELPATQPVAVSPEWMITLVVPVNGLQLVEVSGEHE